MNIMVTYVNKNWQYAVITNSFIRLSIPGCLDRFTRMNHKYSCKSFEPIVLQKKMHASTKLEYSLLDSNEEHFSEIDIWIDTEYVDCQGKRMSDSNKIGKIHISGKGTLIVVIESVTYELQGRNIIMSANL